MRALWLLPFCLWTAAAADENEGVTTILHCRTYVAEQGHEPKDAALFLICEQGVYGILTTLRENKDLFRGPMQPILARDQGTNKFPNGLTLTATVYLGKYPPAEHLNCLVRTKKRDDPAPTVECVSE